jgi:choline dehydrogenase-like flavoprotein
MGPPPATPRAELSDDDLQRVLALADVALGLIVSGVRAGRVALLPIRVVRSMPLIGPVARRAGQELALNGYAARTRWRTMAVDRIVPRVLAEIDVERVVTAVLEDERTERVVERVLASREMQSVIGHVASSPELLEALSRHTETLAEEMVSDVRTRAQRADDLAERTVRGWLRRPRPSTT